MSKFKKIICVAITTIVLVNIILPQLSFASSTAEQIDPLRVVETVIGFPLGAALGVFIAIVQVGVKILLLVPGVLINLILSLVASTGGEITQVTLYKLFFNEIALTDINIFNISGAIGSLATIRETIANCYVSFRNLAIVISLAVLIYIGIQMAINSTASQKAKYKQMLVNWVIGFGLIFLLHYIIILTINLNEMLVTALKPSQEPQIDFTELLRQSWNSTPLTISFGSAIMYSVLLVTTFVFFIVYIKRMLTISFLTVVAPLICITYSIDKVDNNRSEILNTWLSEFLYNVLIQPFHCVIYCVLIGTSMNLLDSAGFLDFGAMVFAVILTFFIFSAQKIIREIFGFGKASTLMEKIAVFSIASSAVGTAKSVVSMKKAKNDAEAEKAVKNLPQTMPDGNQISPDDLVRYRRLAEVNRKSSTSSSSSTSGKRGSSGGSSGAGGAGGTPQTPPTPSKRPLANSPLPGLGKQIARDLWRAGKNVAGTFTGYNAVNFVRESFKKPEVLDMTHQDYIIAAGECFRQEQDSQMTNDELARRTAAIFDETDLNKLSSSELNYRLIMEYVKPDLSRQEIIDAIRFGTSNNARWES